LFIVATLLLIAVIIVGIKGLRTVFVPITERKVHFTLADDVGGLRLGDDVRLGGFKIGVIHRIEVVGLAEGEKPGINITFSMPQKYPVYENADIGVQGTLTGSSWLNIDDLGAGTPLPDGAELPGHPSITSEMLAKLRDVAPEATGLIKDIRHVTLPKVNDKIDKADGMITSIRSFADRGAESLTKARDLLGDTTPDIRGTMAHLNNLTASGEAKVPGILDHVDTALVKVAATVDSAKSALDDAKVTLAHLRDLSGTARSVVVNNKGKLDGIIASLKTTSDNLKGASAEIRRSPWRILYKPAPGELDNMELFDAARQFADGANNVNDASLALRDAMQNPDVDHDQVQKLIDKLNETFQNFHDVEQKLWKAVKE
jgi:ABC-type transporter Mla subunit MlaD